MTETARSSTREIARSAIRAQLSQVALELFWREGFDQVTVSELAAAAGVSRTTFLRYFANKEDAVLSGFDTQGEQLADTLRARPADEDDWTALRRSLDLLVTQCEQNPTGILAMIRLVAATPALRARLLEKQYSWSGGMARALAERTDPPRPATIGLAVRASAALGCLNAANDHWYASDGHLDLGDLLDEAFAAMLALS